MERPLLVTVSLGGYGVGVGGSTLWILRFHGSRLPWNMLDVLALSREALYSELWGPLRWLCIHSFKRFPKSPPCSAGREGVPPPPFPQHHRSARKPYPEVGAAHSGLDFLHQSVNICLVFHVGPGTLSSLH